VIFFYFPGGESKIKYSSERKKKKIKKDLTNGSMGIILYISRKEEKSE